MSLTDDILLAIRLHRAQIDAQGGGWIEAKYGPDGVRLFLRPTGRKDLGAINSVDSRARASVD